MTRSRMTSVPALVLLMTMVAVAAGQRSLSPQQQQQRQQQISRQQQQQQQQQRQKLRPGSLDLLEKDVKIHQIDEGQLKRFFTNEESVKTLTDCFITPQACTNQIGLSLIKQVRQLGVRGTCTDCNKEEEARLHKLIYDFIQTYQTQYAQEWRRALPHLGNLIAFAQRAQ